MPTGNDDFVPADEVRIYKDEGEDDEQLQHASENLSEDKIGLVTETEKRADECNSVQANLAATSGRQSGPMPTWPPDFSAAASLHAYNMIQQYRIQQLFQGFMLPTTSGPSNGMLPMQMQLPHGADIKRPEARREESVPSPQVLSPLSGCSSPMLSVLAAMSNGISPVSSAPLHPHGTPSPRSAAPNHLVGAPSFRGFPPGASPTANAPSISPSWPFNGSSLMPPPASPLAFAMLQMQQASSRLNPAALSNGNGNGCGPALALPQQQPAPSQHDQATRTQRQADRERRPPPTRQDADAERQHKTPNANGLARKRDAASAEVDSRPHRTIASDSAASSEATSGSNARHAASDSRNIAAGAEGDIKPSDASPAPPTRSAAADGASSSASRSHPAPVDGSATASVSASASQQPVPAGEGELKFSEMIDAEDDDMDDDSDDDGNSDDSDDNPDDSQQLSTSSWSRNGDGDHSARHGSQVGSPSSSAAAQARRWTNVKKPLNAFMLFMKEQRATVMGESTLKESAAINQLLGRRWHALERREQEKYYELARRVKEEHARLYPGWSARDNYALHSRRKKRRMLTAYTPPTACASDRPGAGPGSGGPGPLELPGASTRDCASPKKCRARYGLENQKEWCKPCRRKKKCIRFSAESDRPLAPYGPTAAKRPDNRPHELLGVNMLSSPFSLAQSAGIGAPPAPPQFPFGFPLNVEAYLQMAGGPAAYRSPFGPPVPRPPHANLIGTPPRFVTFPPSLVTPHGVAPPQANDTTSTCCPSPFLVDPSGRPRACSTVASHATSRRSDECDPRLLSESDDEVDTSRPNVRPRTHAGADEADDAEEKPVTRASENEKDPPFTFEDEPLSPLSVAGDEAVPLRAGPLGTANSHPTDATRNTTTYTTLTSSAVHESAAAPAATATTSAAPTTAKRGDDDSQNNNAARSRTSAADTSAPPATTAADSGPVARPVDTIGDERSRHSHAADRPACVGVFECNAVS